MSTTEVKKRKQNLKRQVNPDNPSPSGDPYFDDPKNVEALREAIREYEANPGSGTVIRTKQELKEFLDSL